MKNILRVMVLTFVMLIAITMTVSADNVMKVTINGELLTYEEEIKPYISPKGRPMVPLESTLKAFGAEISYDDNTREVKVTKGEHSLIVPIEKQYIKVDGKFLILEEPTVLVNGHTMVEIMPIIHSLRASVNFDPNENLLQIENKATYELLNFVDEIPDWAENPVISNFGFNQDLSGKKLVALTYDDGPNGQSTSIILDVLKEHNARATFFMLGQNVYNYKEQAIRTVNEGHEIANHSYSHKDFTKLGIAGIKKETLDTQTAISSVTGVTPKLLRVPYGAYNQSVKNNSNLPIIGWNIDTLDWKTRSAEKTVNSVLNNVKDGDIVLMHNIHMSTAEATKILVPELIKRGYTLVTVSQLAQAKGINLQNGAVYNSFK